MSRTEELRQQVVEQIETDISDFEKFGDDEYGGDSVHIDVITAKRALELLRKLEAPVDAEWHYYTNDEGKPRWKCTHCGRLCKRRPTDKPRCASCGAHMRFEA